MFKNRVEAGRILSKKLVKYRRDKNATVLSIPRGGIIVGKELAKNLILPHSHIVVKKLSAPNNSELAIGALAPSGVKVIDWELALRIGVDQEYLDEEIKRKSREVEEREKKFKIQSRFNRDTIKDKKIIILVDDGVATGSTVLAAIKYIKEQRTKNKEQKIILAVPVIAQDTYNNLKSEVDPDQPRLNRGQIGVDEIVALEIPDSFSAVGQFYEEFPQVTDEEVLEIITNKYQ